MMLRGDDLIRANPLKLQAARSNRRVARSTCWSTGSTANSSSKPSRSEDEDTGDFQTFYHEVRQATARLQATESEEIALPGGGRRGAPDHRL